MKAVTLVLLWLLGSATAIGVAWSGVGVLDEDLVAPAPAVVTVDGEGGLVSESVDPLGGDAGPLSSDRSTSTVGGATAETVGAPSSTSNATAATSSTPATVGGATTARPTTSMTATTRTTGTSATSGTSATTATTSGSSTTSTTSTSGAPPTAPEQYETRTFTLIGGTTSIRFSPSSTKVLWATPNPGYEVRVEPESGGVKVEFRSDDHRSRVDAWWDNGPRQEIREDD